MTSGALETFGAAMFRPWHTHERAVERSRTILGPDTDIVGATPTGGLSTFRVFDFDADGQLDAGETSDLFFVAFRFKGMAHDGSQVLRFLVNGSTGPDFVVQSDWVQVTEPTGLSLLALGLVAARSNRRDRA